MDSAWHTVSTTCKCLLSYYLTHQIRERLLLYAEEGFDLFEWLQRAFSGPVGENGSKPDLGSKMRSIQGSVGLVFTGAWAFS